MQQAYDPLIRFFFHPRTRCVAAWILAFGIASARWANARFATNKPERLDGNGGHTTVDFGAQWLMGRMVATGHGKELYHMDVLREVAQTAYTSEHNTGEEGIQDADQLTRFFLHPDGDENIGGMLYPPIQAVMMAPFALGDYPQRAYFTIQWVMLGYCFLGGLGIRVLSRGRIWWPMGTALILAFPGCKGGIDLGQNPTFSIMLLIWGWALRVRGYPIAGGLVWGILAFKPVWAASFFLSLILLRQWRMAVAMGCMGALMIAVTLPIVGVESWIYWYKIGQRAAAVYNIDPNWIALSRDLLGMPRRLFIDFDLPPPERDNLLARAMSVAMWMLVFELTIRVFFLRRPREMPLTGPLPAFVFFAAFMCTYHFMYYDMLIAALPVVVLLADPRPFFQDRRLQITGDRIPATWQSRRYTVYLNSFVLSVLGILLLLENTVRHLRLEATIVADISTSVRELTNGTTELSPRLHIGSSDKSAWDVLAIMILWMWCGVCVLWGSRRFEHQMTGATPVPPE